MQDKIDRKAKITALQAGSDHSKNGNPGFDANFSLLANLAKQAVKDSPDIIVFPEYAISGWPYPSEEAINSLAESIPGDGLWYMRYAGLAREISTAILGWLVEERDGKLYSTAFLVNPDGDFVGKYSKVQANLGEQTWWGWSQGESFEPIEYDGIKYGISICADMFFPETVRCESLLGADIIIHQSIADDMGHIVPVRASDSGIPIIMAIFNGVSYAADSQGELLGKLPLETSGHKTFVFEPFKVHLGQKYGGLWIPKLGNLNLRNVKAYSILTDPSTRPDWTQVFLDEKGNPQTKEQLLKRFNGRYDANDMEK